jgi:hypothetical protein
MHPPNQPPFLSRETPRRKQQQNRNMRSKHTKCHGKSRVVMAEMSSVICHLHYLPGAGFSVGATRKENTRNPRGPTRSGKVISTRHVPHKVSRVHGQPGHGGPGVQAGRPRPGRRRREAKCRKTLMQMPNQSKPPADMMLCNPKRIKARSAERGKMSKPTRRKS